MPVFCGPSAQPEKANNGKDIYFFLFFSSFQMGGPLHRNKLRIYEQKMKAIIRDGLTFFVEEDR
jgi:hypothetical protein